MPIGWAPWPVNRGGGLMCGRARIGYSPWDVQVLVLALVLVRLRVRIGGLVRILVLLVKK